MIDSKDTNPKDAIGATKLPMHLIPGTAKAYLAIAFLEGALKYGKYNWRVAGVRSSIYLDAMERHLEKWKNGENVDPRTHVSHLASVMACCAIILDAGEVGMLNDDRPPIAPVAEVIDSLAHTVAHLKLEFADYSPHQYTKEDSPWAPEKDQPSTTENTTPPKKLKSRERRVTKRAEKRKKRGKSTKATVKK